MGKSNNNENIIFLDYNDEQMRIFLSWVKKNYHLSYEEMSNQIGCSRDSLSRFMRGGIIGLCVRRKIIKWCSTNNDASFIALQSLIKTIILSNLSSDDDLYNSFVRISANIASLFKKLLVETTAIPNNQNRLAALERLLGNLKEFNI